MLGKLDKTLPIFSMLENMQLPGKNGIFFIRKTKCNRYIRRYIVRLYYDKQYDTRVYLYAIYVDEPSDDDDNCNMQIEQVYDYIELDTDYINESMYDTRSDMGNNTYFYKENGFDQPDEF